MGKQGRVSRENTIQARVWKKAGFLKKNNFQRQVKGRADLVIPNAKRLERKGKGKIT